MQGNASQAAPGVVEPTSLDHIPHGRWQFDASVAAVFDDMLARSIPNLDTMRTIVTDIASQFVRPGTAVVDLGCSLGGALWPLVEQFAPETKFVGVELSAPMVAACHERFKALVGRGTVEIIHGDIRTQYPRIRASVTLSILTLMFIPLEHRFRVLSNIYDHSIDGGACILVEKVLGADTKMNSLFEDLYRQHKRRMGYSQQAINRKALSLEGVLVPVTASWNEEMLRRTGFSHIECVWRTLNFAAWVAIK
jgi:tRNA (cmo5U34)-methyltransferase